MNAAILRWWHHLECRGPVDTNARPVQTLQLNKDEHTHSTSSRCTNMTLELQNVRSKKKAPWSNRQKKWLWLKNSSFSHKKSSFIKTISPWILWDEESADTLETAEASLHQLLMKTQLSDHSHQKTSSYSTWGETVKLLLKLFRPQFFFLSV